MPTAALATTGSVLTATEYNYLPRGYINGSALITSNITSSGTHTTFQDITGYSGSVTYLGNRILRVVCEVAPYVPGGANGMQFKIVRGSTDVKAFDIPSEALATTIAHHMTLSATFAGPSTGATETFKLQFRAITNNTQVGTGNPGRIYVEDLGSQ